MGRPTTTDFASFLPHIRNRKPVHSVSSIPISISLLLLLRRATVLLHVSKAGKRKKRRTDQRNPKQPTRTTRPTPNSSNTSPTPRLADSSRTQSPSFPLSNQSGNRNPATMDNGNNAAAANAAAGPNLGRAQEAAQRTEEWVTHSDRYPPYSVPAQDPTQERRARAQLSINNFDQKFSQ